MIKSWITVKFKDPINANILAGINNDLVPVNIGARSVRIKYNKNYTDKFTLRLKAINDTIYDNGITIEEIQFEDFWIIKDDKILMTSIPNNSRVYVEHSSDHNVLFFKGDLTLSYYHPIREYLNDPLR
jgi:hypothetical protein